MLHGDALHLHPSLRSRICPQISEVGKKLHIAEHSVLDGAGKAVELAAGLESKGVLGADGRKYLTDLHRVTPRDVNYKGVEKANAVLRPELVSMFAEVSAGTEPLE